MAFHEDGYTDLRGRIDHATLVAGDLAGLTRLALFVAAEDEGSAVREAAPSR